MGKSTSSCLKMITCAGVDPTDGEELTQAVNKASPDKSRWSFRKKSSSHRVLSNNLISEPVSAGNIKENPEVTTNGSRSPKKSQVQERPSIEEEALSSVIVTSLSDQRVGSGDNTITDHHVEDFVAVVIQAAIRKYLAQRDLQKLKNIVKLQAAIREHLVRRQAVGTLRCIQAIVKMQIQVRARYAQLAAKEDKKSLFDIERPMLRRNMTSTEPNRTYSSTEKLLKNRFACQLMESTPKTKHTHIKCDPLQSDLTWKWLERWTTVTSLDTRKELEQDPFHCFHGQIENVEQAVSISTDLKFDASKLSVTNEGERNSISKNSAAIEFQPPTSVSNDYFSSLPKNKDDHFQLEKNEALSMEPGNLNATEIGRETSNPFSGQIPLVPDAIAQTIIDSTSDITESDSHKPKATAERPSSEPLENEGKKFTLGSRKPCNPAFVAAQSKFVELSSTITPVTPHQDALAESKFESPNIQIDSSTKNTDLSSVENKVPHDSRDHIATSECGTEISISSTLDSPDRSEAEGGEIVLEVGTLGKGNYVNHDGPNDVFDHPSAIDTENVSSLDTEVPQPQITEEGKGDGDFFSSIAATDAEQLEQRPEETSTPVMKNQTENLIEPQVSKSSPSQESVNSKKGKKDNAMATRKLTIQLVGKKSPSNPNIGSSGKSSTEHLAKDPKAAKRRNSLGTNKLDFVDHEPRISSSSSLPSYMQATESARAKAHASISPKSSPDVHHKDNYTKKRHSFPTGDDKQGSSPRMQRSASQAQQNLKANDTHSPHNSTERRWQR